MCVCTVPVSHYCITVDMDVLPITIKVSGFVCVSLTTGV